MDARPEPSTEVLVAGAGPVGLALAAELARHGVGLRIVEQAARRTDKSKALVVWSRTLELMEIMGCVESFLAEGMKVTRGNIYARTRRIAEIFLDRVESPHAYALFLPQSDTERLLERHLASFGVPVERGVELTGFAADDRGVRATLTRSDGARETLSARWLVGCDGAHSTVRHELGMPFSGATEPFDFLLADLRLDGDIPGDELSLFWHPLGLLGIFPMSRGRFRVIADLGAAPASGKPADPTLAEVQAALDQRGPGGIVARDPIWLSAFRINERKVATYRQGAVFLAGDAAHIHSPAGGQGMNTGIQDACNLAWKLAFVARGRAHETLLDTYSAERSAVGERVLRNATWLTRVAVVRNPWGRWLRNGAFAFLSRLPAFQHRLAMAMTELDIAYRGAPLSVGPSGGRRAPDRRVRQLDGNPVSLYRLLRADRFVLLAASRGGAADPARRAALEALAARYPAALVVATEDGPDGLTIVRPDSYVGFSARAVDLAAAESYLASFLIPG
jgi:2-polyprenyl-6-methoxyphenol hydroxylase-like FAD-dependent oxidoreductase